MRTVILAGALLIRDALNPKPLEELVARFIFYIFIAAIIMDISDFVRNK